MFRELQIKPAKFFLRPEQYDAEILICQAGLSHDVFLCLFFKIEGPQDAAVALRKLFHRSCDGLAAVEQFGFGHGFSGRFGNDLRHRVLPVRPPAVFGDDVAAYPEQKRARGFRIANFFLLACDQKPRKRFLHNVIDVGAKEPDFVTYLEPQFWPQSLDILWRQSVSAPERSE